MKQLASSLLVSTGLLVLIPTLIASNTEAGGAPSLSSAAQLSATTAAEDHVVLERRFNATRGPCTELGVPTNRVFPDGTRESFVVPAGKAFVLTDLEGEITEKLGATWFVGTIGVLNATLTGAVANQHVRARAPLDAAAVSAGIATLKLHLESGVVADSGAAVCLSAVVIESNGFRSASVGTDVRVSGYLIAR
jgi:hypothetical protein